MWRTTLLLAVLVTLAMAEPLEACSDLRLLLLQYNLASQASRELFNRFEIVSGLLGQVQAYSVQRGSSTTVISVCLLPPLECDPSIDRAGQLMRNIWNASDSTVLFTYSVTKACYVSPSTPTTCEKLVFTPSSGCLDANLVVSAATLDNWFGLQRGNLGGLLLADSGSLWTQLASNMANTITSTDLALQVAELSSLSAGASTSSKRRQTWSSDSTSTHRNHREFVSTSATSPNQADITLKRIAEDLYRKASVIPTLLGAILPLQSSLSTVSLEANVTASVSKVITSYVAQWNSLISKVLGAGTSLPSLSHHLLIPQQREILRGLVRSFALASLEIVSLHYQHLADDLKSTTAAANFLASFTDGAARLEAYKVPTLVSHLQDLSVSFFNRANPFIEALKAQRSANEWPHHFLTCFSQQLGAVQQQFNLMVLALDGESSTMDILCAASGVTQEFGLFSESPMQTCLFGALSKDLRYVAIDTSSITSPDLYIITTHLTNISTAVRNITTGLTTSRWTSGAFNSSSTSSSACSTLQSTNGNTEVIRALGSLNLPISFDSSPLADVSILSRSYSRGSIITINYNASIVSAIDTRDMWSSVAPFLTPPISTRRHSQLQEQTTSSTTTNCTPGYYALYNNVTGLFSCEECPEGSYCLGTDGLKRLCSNGPLDRVVFTQRRQTNSSCPFVCAAYNECRTGDDCVVPGPGQMCLASLLQNCSLLPLPALWQFQNQCTATLHHAGYVSTLLDAYVDSTSCVSDPFSTVWTAATQIPSYNFDLSISVRINAFITSNSASTINLAYSPGNYRLSIELAATGKAVIIFALLSSSNMIFQEYRSSVPITIILNNWYRVRVQVSVQNYLIISLDNLRIVFYDFYDATPLSLDTTLGPKRKLLFGSVEPSNGLQTVSYSLKSLIYASSNLTSFSDYFDAFPDGLNGDEEYYCDLTNSYFTSQGVCAPLRCPGDYMTRVNSSDVSIPSFCVCDESPTNGDGSNACSSTLTTTSSDTLCSSGDYMTWSGTFLKISVVEGYGFISDVLLHDNGGNRIKPLRCSDLDRIGLTCMAALEGMTIGGWKTQTGSSGLFFLPTDTPISSISIKARSYILSDDSRDLEMTLEVAISNTLREIASASFDVLLTNNWVIHPNPIDTSPEDETYAILDPTSALWTWQELKSNVPTWNSIFACYTCPAGALLSLSPRASVQDCLCQNGNIPDAINGCQDVQRPSCPEPILDPPPGLYDGPISVSFRHNDTVYDVDPSVGISIDLLLTKTATSESTASHFWLLPFQSITLSDSATLEYSMSCSGQPSSAKRSALYELTSPCSTPFIVSGITSSSGASQQRLVSVFWDPTTPTSAGGLASFAIQAEISIDYNVATAPSGYFPDFQPYTGPFFLTTDAIIRARTFETGSVAGRCSNSSIARSFISVSSTDASVASVQPGSNSCGLACAGAIVALVALAVITIGVLLAICNHQPKQPSRPLLSEKSKANHL